MTETSIPRKTYTDEEAKSYIEGLRNGSVRLTCGRHNYVYKKGGLAPLTSGCADCWKVYYIGQFALTPKENQYEFVELLESAVHHAVEAVEKGEFDFQPFAHPEISIEKDAE